MLKHPPFLVSFTFAFPEAGSVSLILQMSKLRRDWRDYRTGASPLLVSGARTGFEPWSLWLWVSGLSSLSSLLHYKVTSTKDKVISLWGGCPPSSHKHGNPTGSISVNSYNSSANSYYCYQGTSEGPGSERLSDFLKVVHIPSDAARMEAPVRLMAKHCHCNRKVGDKITGKIH